MLRVGLMIAGEQDITHLADPSWRAKNPRGRVTIPATDTRPCLGCNQPVGRTKENYIVRLATGEYRTVCSGLCAVQVTGSDKYAEAGKQYAAHHRALKEQAKAATEKKRAEQAAQKAEGLRRNALVIASRSPEQQAAARDSLGRFYVAPALDLDVETLPY